jgi:hypothetical protein
MADELITRERKKRTKPIPERRFFFILLNVFWGKAPVNNYFLALHGLVHYAGRFVYNWLSSKKRVKAGWIAVKSDLVFNGLAVWCQQLNVENYFSAKPVTGNLLKPGTIGGCGISTTLQFTGANGLSG